MFFFASVIFHWCACYCNFVTSITTFYHREEHLSSFESLRNKLIFRNRARRQNITEMSYWIDLRSWCKAQLIFRDRWGRRGRGCFFIHHLPFLFTDSGATCFSILMSRWRYSITGVFLKLCYLESRLYVSGYVSVKEIFHCCPESLEWYSKACP